MDMILSKRFNFLKHLSSTIFSIRRLILLVLIGFCLPVFAEQTFNIGIYSERPKVIMEKRWLPLKSFLESKIAKTRFNLVFLSSIELEKQIRNNELDFVFTNPRHYIILRQQLPLSGAIATLITKHNDIQAQLLGGVIFTRSDRSDINQINDLADKSIVAGASNLMGGYQAPLFELSSHGVNVNENVNIEFVGTPLDTIVHQVLQGKYDAGFIKTGILEELSDEGLLNLKKIKIINRQNLPGYPYQVSTRLYPEWPLIVMPNVELQIANKMASAILELNYQHEVSKALGIGGFSYPADYFVVENMMRLMRLPPFNQSPEVRWIDIWKQHRDGIILLCGAISIIILQIFLLLGRNRQITHASNKIEENQKIQNDLLNNTPALIYIKDLDDRFIFINQCFEKLFGVSQENIIGKKQVNVLPLTLVDTLSAHDAEVIAKGEALEFEETLEINKQTRTFLSTRFPLRDIKSEINAICAFAIDITERKQAEQEIQRFKTILDGSLNEIYLFNEHNLQFVSVNTGARHNMGYQLDELLSMSPLDIGMFKNKNEFQSLTQPLKKGHKRQITFNTLHKRKNGSLYPAEIHLQLTEEAPLLYIAFVTDITQRKLAETQLKTSEFLKKQILQTIPDLMWLRDGSGRYLMCNAAYEDFIGYKESEMIGLSDYELMDFKLAEIFASLDKKAQKSDQPVIHERKLTSQKKNISGIYEIILAPLKEQDQVIGILGMARDITERKQTEEQLRLAASVFQHTQEGILITDSMNNIIDVNPAACQLTGYQREELISRNPKMLSVNQNPKEDYHSMWETLKKNNLWEGELWNTTKQGQVYAERLSIAKIMDDWGNVTHYIGVFSDITYLKNHQQELEKIAKHDALTELPNRLLLRERMQQALTSNTNYLVAVCYLDLDGFKPINDTYGHKAGDLVLIEVAHRLRHNVKPVDTVSRLGGDEFVLLIVDLDNIDQLKQSIRQIIESLNQAIELPNGTAVQISASIGITIYPDDDHEADILLRHADQAMYQAKQGGKNRFAFFEH